MNAHSSCALSRGSAAALLLALVLLPPAASAAALALDAPEISLQAYRAELGRFRQEFGGARDLPDERYFLFGLGLRQKLLYKGGALVPAPSGAVLRRWDVREEFILPAAYAVVIRTTGGTETRIVEDAEGVWIEEGGQRTALPGTEAKVQLPDFAGYQYPAVMRVLHQELLVNVTTNGPVPNFFVYPKPWYRDGAMMAMVFRETGNLDCIRAWVLGLRQPYDRNNNGETEADNLGQALFLVSSVSTTNHPLVPKVLAEVPRFERRSGETKFITGRSDFAEHPVYQTKWLKFGLRALGLPDDYTVPRVSDGYSALFWMDYKDTYRSGKDADDRASYPYLGWACDHFHGAKKSPISNRDYPLTWEAHASQADYAGMRMVSEHYTERKLAAPHTWHAAEILLYLLGAEPTHPARPITVASYYFGNYHPGDPRNSKMKGTNWSEWELVKAAKPRFPGHQQPKVPLWGYLDESDPKVMARKIGAAADHGIDAFIFDWYYYDDGPFLDRPIDIGFLQATNNHRLKFAFMWANHDWLEIQPYKRGTPQKLLFPGKVTPTTFSKICDHVIQNYLQHPSYWRIDGRPYFSFYDLTELLESFGSVDATRAALDQFRAKARAAGLPGLHLNAVVWGQPILPREKKPADAPKLVRQLGFDSVTSYVWIHHVPLPEQVTDYNFVRDEYFTYWDRAKNLFGVPYYPNVSMGWDSSPRAAQEDEFGNFGYPFTNTIGQNTPENFRAALEKTKQRLLAEPSGPRILNINCWNEWTEGSYLEPDTVHGMKYLEAVRAVFKTSK